MPVLRITKEFNNLSQTPGLIIADTVEFASRDDGNAWVRAVLANDRLEWTLKDWEWALIAPGEKAAGDAGLVIGTEYGKIMR